MQENNLTIMYSSIFDDKYEIGINFQDKGIDFPIHYHNFVEIVCQINGQSKQTVDGKDYLLNTGEILIIHPQSTHSNIASNSDIINLIISEKFMNTFVIEGAFDISVINIKHSLINSIHTQKYTLPVRSKLILNEIFENFINPSNLYNYKQKLYISQFLIYFFEETNTVQKDLPHQKFDLISYIQSNLKTASLTEFAAMHNYSESLTSKKIKTEYNMTFMEIIKDIRMKTAAKMLIDGNTKIDKIIHDIGYQSKTHFYQLFKERYKMSPRDYRLLANKNKQNEHIRYLNGITTKN